MSADDGKLGFRQVAHVGFNVSDVDRTVKYYEEILGIQPYVFVDENDLQIVKAKSVYYGWDAPTAIELSQVISEKEGLAFELGDSYKLLWSSFLAKKGQGIHHLSFPVEDLEEELRRFKGFTVVRDPREPPEWAYIDTTEHGGTIFELVVGPKWPLQRTVPVRKSRKNSKLMPTRMSHIGIVVEDMERTLKFWEDAFGMKPTLYIPEYRSAFGSMKYAFYDFPEGLVMWELAGATWVKPDLDEQELNMLKAFERGRGDEANHIAFAVDDVALESERLKRKGIQELLRHTRIPPAWVCFDTRKQAGVKIEIMLRPELMYPKEEGKIHRISKVKYEIK